MKRLLFITTLLTVLLTISLEVKAQSAYYCHPMSEGPVFSKEVVPGEPLAYYDNGCKDGNMRGNLALTQLQLKPAIRGYHITIVFSKMAIGEFDEMRIYSGVKVLNNYYNSDYEEYVYDWPKNATAIFSSKGNPSSVPFVVSSNSEDGVLTVCFRNNSKEEGWEAIVYAVKNGDPEPSIEGEKNPNISFTIINDLGTDEDGYDIDEKDITLTLGAIADNTAIQIDFGNGPEDYTIASATSPSSITKSVAAGGTVKIYGELSLFDASGNRLLNTITFGENPSLERLRLSANKIKALNIHSLEKLKELSITDNSISVLDVSNQPLLEELYAGYNPYPELRTTLNPELNTLTCYNTNIEELNLSNNTHLKVLKAGGNSYRSTIDLSNNTALTSLDLEDASLTSIKMKELVNLERLYLKGNKLKNIDISTLKRLQYLDISSNSFDACNLTDLFFELPNMSNDPSGIIKINRNPGAEQADTKWTTTFGWTSDTQGNGEGCPTVRIRQKESENGAYIVKNGNENLADWTPVNRGTELSVEVTPASDKYEFAKLIYNDVEIPNKTFEANAYGYLAVVFRNAGSIGDIDANSVTISKNANNYIIQGLPTEEKYFLSSSSGQILSTGKTSSDGSLILEIPREIITILQVGPIMIKLL